MTDPRAVLKPGAILERKTAQNDVFDRVIVRGFAEFDGGALVEVCVQPVDFGPTLTVDLEALDRNYVCVGEGEPVGRFWQTSELDLLTRRDSTITTTPPSTVDARKPDEPLALSVQAFRKFQEGNSTTKEQDQ